MSAIPQTVEPAIPTSDSLFPPADRVVYERAPLLSVVAQLRFPRVLRIESGPPADFQDRIRDTFPLVEQGPQPMQAPIIGQPIQVMPQIPLELMQLLNAQAAQASYRFLTEDRKTTLTLSPEAISLSTTSYSHWGEFKTMFGVPIDALNEIYKPSFFTRVGLRYVNVIDREVLQLRDKPWSKLLRPEILGELALPQFEAVLETTRRQLRLKTSDMNIFLQHGTALTQNVPHTPKQTYGFDCDFSSAIAKTVISDAQSRLDELNNRAFRAFRWAITDDLHRALGPKVAD